MTASKYVEPRKSKRVYSNMTAYNRQQDEAIEKMCA